MLKQNPTARFILQRAGWYVLTFFVAIAINFVLPRLGSTNPVDIIMGQSSSGLSPEQAKQKEDTYLKQFGLAELDAHGNVLRDAADKPVIVSKMVQFKNYVKMTLHGDLGTSIQKYPDSVLKVIGTAVPWTIALQLPTIIFGWIIGNALGALAAYKRGLFDKIFFPLAIFFNSFPFFVFGMLLVYYFAVVLDWFPAMGGYAEDLTVSLSLPFLGSALYHYVLPFFSIFLITAGGQAIGMRSMGIYELGTDYVKYAQWLGLRNGRILAYIFRNAMLPQLTGLALSLGTMVGGALVTEMIFSYPGLGMAMLTAVQNHDYFVIQGVTLLITICVLIANFSVDILIAFLDPRVKAGLQMGGN